MEIRSDGNLGRKTRAAVRHLFDEHLTSAFENQSASLMIINNTWKGSRLTPKVVMTHRVGRKQWKVDFYYRNQPTLESLASEFSAAPPARIKACSQSLHDDEP